MIRLLILSSGTNASYHVAKTLREKFPSDFYIVGADINPRHLIATANLLNAFYQVPYTSDPKYYSVILGICRKEKINVLLPSFDADQRLFFPENTELNKLGIMSLGTPEESLLIYGNKQAMNAFLAKRGFPVPLECTNADPRQEYFVKPKNGVGSIGARKIQGVQWEKLAERENLILQEICQEPEITLECFYYQNRLSCVARERIAAKAGVCVKTRVYRDESLEQIAQKLVHCCKTPLYFNLQFMKNSVGKFVITDVNFRLAGGMSLSYAAGWDEVSALAKVLLKKDGVFDTLPSQIDSQYIVRVYTDIVTQKTQPVVAFDWDGTLLDSRKRHQLVMDAVLKECNVRVDTSKLIEFKRGGKNNIDFLISQGVPEECARQIQTEWMKRIEEPEFLAEDVLYPGTLDWLESCSRGNDLILVTARNNVEGLQTQIDKFNLRKFFKEIFVVPSGKEVAEKKAEILKAQQVTLMIGDTRSDAVAARNAGVKFQFHENGFHAKETVGV